MALFVFVRRASHCTARVRTTRAWPWRSRSTARAYPSTRRRWRTTREARGARSTTRGRSPSPRVNRRPRRCPVSFCACRGAHRRGRASRSRASAAPCTNTTTRKPRSCASSRCVRDRGSHLARRHVPTRARRPKIPRPFRASHVDVNLGTRETRAPVIPPSRSGGRVQKSEIGRFGVFKNCAAFFF